MTQNVQLQYPDQTPASKILDDLTVLSRNTGQRGHRAAAAIDPAETDLIAKLGSKLLQRAIPTADYQSGGGSPTDATVSNGATLPLQTNGGTASGNVTATVAASAVSNVKLPASTAVIGNGATVAVRNSAGADSHNGTSVTTAAGALTGVNLAATVALVDNADSVPLLPAAGTTPAQGSGTAAVASGVIAGVRLPATSAVVTNGQTIAVTGGTVTITVANNVVTAAFTAS